MSNLKRVPNDFYPTPKEIVKQLIDKHCLVGSVFEPCAGHGAITEVINSYERFNIVTESDLIWDLPDHRNTNDASKREFWDQEKKENKFDWVITNPPFNLAPKILPLAYEYSNKGVAFLLRLSYLEPCKNRYEWLREHADQLAKIIVVGGPRIRFRSDVKGTDSVTCAWFIFDKKHSWYQLGLESPFDWIVKWKM